jgi:methyl-accepting chemotaxis protein
MADPLSELKKDLEVLAKPNLGGNATKENTLEAVHGLFTAIESAEFVGPVIKALSEAIHTGFDEVATALKAIAKEVKELDTKNGNHGTLNAEEVATALTGLQNALSTAAALTPGAKSVSAVGAPVLELISKLLEDLKSFEQAANTLEEIAQQLETIGEAL